ncbi:NAD-dependent epimerase/dehydratase family protein [Paenibacillus silvisoli]|uniref:NAD-dependent epimerase/dehydratase family protein n=1 Tax=Paenibacillus silvisoli TaxID=3110539 RepID=UPI0028055B36|nr:NAD-dependent epimerase/dehydratase family protein [Paenibacillus silvisoli]
MKVLLFGATGMVGQSVLRECLLDPQVTSITAVGRSVTGQQHPKLHDIKHGELLDLSAIEERVQGFDACFFCLGVSSAGMSEAKYRELTYDLTLSIARTLARLNPRMTFIYVSGSGTDSTERGRSMWARVKGKTENDLLKLPFQAAYMFRPGAILPKNGVRSKTKLYQAIYDVMRPFYPLLERGFKNGITTSEKLGRAMINIVRQGYHTPFIESSDINKLGS